MKPTVGRSVHYVASPERANAPAPHRAATITEVYSDTAVRLAVLHPDHLEFTFTVCLDSSGQQVGSWHWPEREENVERGALMQQREGESL